SKKDKWIIDLYDKAKAEASANDEDRIRISRLRYPAQSLNGPDDTVATYRGETLCMSGKAGELAKWTVKERDKSRLSLEPWGASPGTAQIPSSPPSAEGRVPEPELADSGP